MLSLRRAADRGRASFGWLDSRHTFSFGEYYDPQHMGFGPLRVINDDRVAPGGGFAPHGHANMEIITYVVEGELEHRDSLGHGSVIRPGDVQRMSAGLGIRHSEFNASRVEPVRFLQIWVQPDQLDAEADYAQKFFPDSERSGRLCLVIDPSGADGALSIRQDARMYAGLLKHGEVVTHALDRGRRAWVQVARGALQLNGQALTEGDGAALREVDALHLCADSDGAEVLVFDLP